MRWQEYRRKFVVEGVVFGRIVVVRRVVFGRIVVVCRVVVLRIADERHGYVEGW